MIKLKHVQATCTRINLYEVTKDTAISQGFEGIPQNFTVNIVAFIV